MRQSFSSELMNKSERDEARELLLELWDFCSEERTDEIFCRLKEILPHPNWSDYLYYSEDYVNGDLGLEVDDLLDKIYSYKPICL